MIKKNSWAIALTCAILYSQFSFMPMLHHKSREWICTNIVSSTSLAYQSIPSTSDLRKGSAEEEKSCKTTRMHQYKRTLLCFLSVQQDYRSCFWKVVIYIILFPIYPIADTQNDFYINGCLPLFKDIDKKKVFWSPKKSPSHSDSSHWGFPVAPMPGNANTASRSAWGFMNPVGLGTGGFNRWDFYQRHLRGKVVDNEKNLSKLHVFF